MKWFRMYTDFLDDPKLIALAFEDQRHFVAILACKAQGLLDPDCEPKMLDRIVAQRIWVDYALILDVKKRLIDARLIDTQWQPVAWDRRQFKSDEDWSVAERQRRHREKLKGGTSNALRNALRNGTVTPPDTETETDTDTEEAIYPPDTSGGGNDSEKVSKEKLPPCPAQEIVSLYHSLLPTCRQVAVITETRRSHLQQRWREMYAAGEFKTQAEGLEAFSDYFKYVGKSAFLTGRVKTQLDRKPFVADLEWLVKPGNFAKIIEGKYQ